MLDHRLLRRLDITEGQPLQKTAFVPNQAPPITPEAAQAAQGAPPPQGGQPPPGAAMPPQGMPPGAGAPPPGAPPMQPPPGAPQGAPQGGGIPPELAQLIADPNVQQLLQSYGIAIDPNVGPIDMQSGQPIPPEQFMQALNGIMQEQQGGGQPPAGQPAPEAPQQGGGDSGKEEKHKELSDRLTSLEAGLGRIEGMLNTLLPQLAAPQAAMAPDEAQALGMGEPEQLAAAMPKTAGQSLMKSFLARRRQA